MRDEAVVLEVFPSRLLAEMAAQLLAQEGIDCLILADDAGGAYPPLQAIRGVRLLVDAADAFRARQILEAAPLPEDDTGLPE
ncbi:MAG: DUF2007 domain-containing protein [Desulfobaccales bacterium]|jgi:hypothetical protein